MSGIFDRPDGASTPLTPEEMRDLIPADIAFRHELNAVEQANILRGQDWALARRRDLMTEKFLMDLFPNGNGRHARLHADLLIMQLGGHSPFVFAAGVNTSCSFLRAFPISAALSDERKGLLPSTNSPRSASATPTAISRRSSASAIASTPPAP